MACTRRGRKLRSKINRLMQALETNISDRLYIDIVGDPVRKKSSARSKNPVLKRETEDRLVERRRSAQDVGNGGRESCQSKRQL